MNQILYTKFRNEKKETKREDRKILNNKNSKIKLNKKFFKLQFFFSIFIVFLVICYFTYYTISLKNKENLSNNLINNYNISKLYANYNSSENMNPNNNIFGILEIPKINLYYPIFSSLSDDLLKIAPCKFHGESPNQNGNLCIAGHNYDNSLFFSNIGKLLENDEIFIYDNLGDKYVYHVFDVYEVNYSDLSPVTKYDTNIKQLTLITCNNLNSKRIVVKAKQ